MFIFIVISFVFLATYDAEVETNFSDDDEEWAAYKRRHNKSYEVDADRLHRDKHFENKRMVHAHNKAFLEGKHAYEVEINQFSDLLDEDLQRYHGALDPKRKNYDAKWNAYKRRYNKVYDGEADRLHKEKFLENKRMVDAHNILLEHKNYEMEINEFSDLLEPELRRKTGGARPSPASWWPSCYGSKPKHFSAPSDGPSIPESIDWREHGYVTPVKHQTCGNCYAFAATGAMEGQYFKKYGHLVSFSEQELSDCTSVCWSTACDGGYVEETFGFAIHNGGIAREQQYPYDGKDNACRASTSEKYASFTGYLVLDSMDEELMKVAVATVGPLAGYFYVSNKFYHFRRGVFMGEDCPSSEQVNHAILIVGYGTEHGVPYWLIKNSWGPDVGVNGYYKVLRNHNTCQIARQASYPIIG